jgi:hypothetical protein
VPVWVGWLKAVALIVLGLVGFAFRSNDIVVGLVVLGIGFLGFLDLWYGLHGQRTRDEKRAEQIRDLANDVYQRAKVLWLGCSEAERLGSDVDDPGHPEWRRIGRFTGNDFSVIFVESAAGKRWYLGISNPDESMDSYIDRYAVCAHLPGLLRLNVIPDAVSDPPKRLAPLPACLAVDKQVDGWARDELNAPLTFAIMFTWQAI